MHVAAFGGYAEALEALLESGADPAEANSRGLAPLHAACMNGHSDCARLLLARGAAPDARDEARAVPALWHCATACAPRWRSSTAGEASLCGVRQLRGSLPLARGAQEENTCLHYAAMSGSVECLRLAKERRPALDVNPENHVRSPAPQPSPLSMRTLAMRMPRPRAHAASSRVLRDLSQEAWTPLHTAAFAGKEAFVEALLSAGAAKDALTEIVRAAGHSASAQPRAHPSGVLCMYARVRCADHTHPSCRADRSASRRCTLPRSTGARAA